VIWQIDVSEEYIITATMKMEEEKTGQFDFGKFSENL
jgi:hypothetical protein